MNKNEFSINRATSNMMFYIGAITYLCGLIGGLFVPLLFSLISFGLLLLVFSQVQQDPIIIFTPTHLQLKLAPMRSKKSLPYHAISQVDLSNEKKIVFNTTGNSKFAIYMSQFSEDDKNAIIERCQHDFSSRLKVA